MLGVRADALFEDYVGRQMVNRPSDPEFTVQFKNPALPFFFYGREDETLKNAKDCIYSIFREETFDK